jgi:hypothetical protein
MMLALFSFPLGIRLLQLAEDVNFGKPKRRK